VLSSICNDAKSKEEEDKRINQSHKQTKSEVICSSYRVYTKAGVISVGRLVLCCGGLDGWCGTGERSVARTMTMTNDKWMTRSEWRPTDDDLKKKFGQRERVRVIDIIKYHIIYHTYNQSAAQRAAIPQAIP